MSLLLASSSQKLLCHRRFVNPYDCAKKTCSILSEMSNFKPLEARRRRHYSQPLTPPPSHTITITFDIHTFGTSTTWSNMSNGTTLFGIKAGRSVVLSQTIRTFKLPIADLLLRFSTWLSFSSMASLRLSSNSSWFLILNSFGHCSTECGLP